MKIIKCKKLLEISDREQCCYHGTKMCFHPKTRASVATFKECDPHGQLGFPPDCPLENVKETT
jgi:hypothetical protein